jgi:proteasome lid subunit RPN8/RPN11
MIGVFHSHISGDEKESEFDIKMADNCCQPFLIYSLNTKKINIYTPKTIESDVNILERVKAAK